VSEVTTTLTGFEAKPGENANGTYVLLRFTADDGKKYQTFDEELGERMKARIGQKSVIAFEVQQRNSNGKTFTNNVATDIFEPGSQPAASNGASAGASVAASPVLERVAAVRGDDALRHDLGDPHGRATISGRPLPLTHVL